MLRFILIGHPVSHSISPAIHNATYQQMGLAAEYAAVDCPDEAAVAACVEAIRRGELAGANVTVPWKRVALAQADRADSTAAQSGAANVLVRDARGAAPQVVAYNTDIIALSDRLRGGLAQSGGAASPACALVLGSGGAALAAVVACRQLGVRRVLVAARRWSVAEPPRDWSRAAEFSALGAELVAWDNLQEPFADAVAPSARPSLVIQATSAGMLGTNVQGAGSGQSVVDVIPWSHLPQASFVYDVVYNPPRTPFLERAAQAGVAHAGGLGMLVGQAARAIELWLGQAPPEDFMHSVAEQTLFGK